MYDRMLSPTDLASYLGIPVSTIYQWRYQGSGPPGFRVGKHVRFRWSDVEEWLESVADQETPHGLR
jgi:excisionase family DNA binding protein